MRFFSNEAKDNTDEQDRATRAEQQDRAEHGQAEHQRAEQARVGQAEDEHAQGQHGQDQHGQGQHGHAEHAPSEPVAVPQQRAGSPWQHGPADAADRPVVAEPAPQPTAFGASTVGGAVAASATAGPYETRPTDRTTDADSGPAGDRIDDRIDDRTDDRTVPLGDRAAADDDADRTVPLGNRPAADADRDAVTGNDRQADDHGARRDADDNPVDLALDDRGTFDDPQVRTGDDTAPGVAAVAVHDKPVVEEKAAETPAPISGPAPFFPAGDTDAMRERWRDVQLRFVDDPKGATAEAAGLVDEAVDKLTTALREHRGSLSKGTDETEALRVELRAYRDILDRLLGL